MSLISKTLKAFVGGAALTTIAVFGATPAQAFHVTFGGSSTANNGVFSTVAGAVTVDFNGVTAPQVVSNAVPYASGLATYRSPGSQSGTGPGRIVRGSAHNRFAAPPNDFFNYLTLGAQGADQEPGPVEISFGKLMNYFGLYWGSIDQYNSIAFFQNGNLIKGYGSQAGFTSIADLFAGQNVNFGAQNLTGARYVNFFALNSNQWFDRIVLTSSTAAFESDNHAYREIPTPALLPAALGFGAAMLRKRKGEKAEKEAVGVKA